MAVASLAIYPTARQVTDLTRALLKDNNPDQGHPWQIISAARTADIFYITTDLPHGFIKNDLVQQAGFDNSDPSFNGTVTILTGSGNTYTAQSAAGANANVSLDGYEQVQAYGKGSWATDPVLIPYVNAAVLDLRNKLAANGQTSFKNEVIVTIPAVTVIQPYPSSFAAIGYGTQPALPANLIEPLHLRERLSGSCDPFVEMTDMTDEGGLPSLEQGAVLGLWEWVTDTIRFIGSSNTIDVRLRYEMELGLETDGASVIPIAQAQNALSFAVAGMAIRNDNAGKADTWTQNAADGFDGLCRRIIRHNQSFARRRLPYGGRRGGVGRLY